MVRASHTSRLVQGRAWKLIIPVDPPVDTQNSEVLLPG